MSRGVGPLEGEAQSESDHGLRAAEPSRVLSMEGGRKVCLTTATNELFLPQIQV